MLVRIRTAGGQGIKEPWLLSVLFAMAIPLLPEYVAPFLAGGSLLAAYYDASRRRRILKVGPVGKALLVYMAYMLFGVLYSRHPASTLATAAMWAVMFCVYLSLANVLTDRRRLMTALRALSAVAGLVGIIGCLEYLLAGVFHWNVPLSFWSFLDNRVFALLPMEILTRGNGMRVYSTFTNPNILAEYVVMALPFIAYGALAEEEKEHQLFYRFCLLAAAGGLAFSFSRTSYIAVLAMALVFCAAYIRKIGFIAATAVSVFFLIPMPVITRSMSVVEMDDSVMERLQVWRAGIHAFGDHPLLGIGAGVSGSWDLLRKYGIMQAPHMHNLFLQLLTEGGVIALILMAVAGVKMLRHARSLWNRSGQTRLFGVSLLAFCVGFVVNGLADFPLMTPKLVGVFLMAAGLGDGLARLYLKTSFTPLRVLVEETPARLVPHTKEPSGYRRMEKHR